MDQKVAVAPSLPLSLSFFLSSFSLSPISPHLSTSLNYFTYHVLISSVFFPYHFPIFYLLYFPINCLPRVSLLFTCYFPPRSFRTKFLPSWFCYFFMFLHFFLDCLHIISLFFICHIFKPTISVFLPHYFFIIDLLPILYVWFPDVFPYCVPIHTFFLCYFLMVYMALIENHVPLNPLDYHHVPIIFPT